MLAIKRPLHVTRSTIRLYSSSVSYKDLPEESKKIIDRIIRVDHAGI